MTRTRILNLEPEGYCADAREILNRCGEVIDGPLDRSALLNMAGEFDVIVVRLAHEIDDEMLEHAKRLRTIVSATTGLDHVDLDSARARGIEVLSLRGETELLRTITATAEHTWALLLALVRRVTAAHASVIAGQWDRDRFRGHELANKRLGILGLGRVGTHVARYGLAFGMSVQAYDIDPTAAAPGIETTYSLPDLLGSVDVLSVHVPLNDATRGLLGRSELETMPRGAWLVNTSRADVVDEVALLDRLANAALAGAALDMISGERQAGAHPAHPLVEYARAHDNLVLTPHLGGAAVEAMAKTEVFMARRLASHLGVEV